MDQRTHRLSRLQFRAWHRGTREADYMMGGFFDTYNEGWSDVEIDWFEQLLDIDDPDILDWALGKTPAPARFEGPLMDALRKLDYVNIPR